MKLSDAAIRGALARSVQYKMGDGNGLYLLVTPKGKKYWRMDYRFAGKRKTVVFGVYPDVKLKAARDKCYEAKSLLKQGIDPGQKKAVTESADNHFETVAREWFGKQAPKWAPGHAKRVIRRLEKDIFPHLGGRKINTITPLDFLKVLRTVENRNAVETAHRLRQTCGQIFRYAIITGRAENDITAALKDALSPAPGKHMATITDPAKVGELLRAIDGYQGQFITICALKLAPLTFVRPGELRHAEWDEIDTVNAMWKIPSEKMKMSRPHMIPLSRQAVAIIEALRPYTGERSPYLFPSIRTAKRPMSDNTVLAALRRMGYSTDEMSGHGFRALASTLLHENRWPSHCIELQLAHVERNSVKAAYNHAQYLDERREMMQWWADYLDKLREEKPGSRTVIPFPEVANR